MKFTKVRDLKYSSANNSTIDLLATCSEYGEIPMTLNIVDTEDIHYYLDGEELKPLEEYCKTQQIAEYVYTLTAEEQEANLMALYKLYYLEKFNAKLDELDYDDISTVGVWAIKTGSTFQAEAKALLNWYEAIISKNYEILNAIKKGDREMPSREEYLAELPLYTTYEI